MDSCLHRNDEFAQTEFHGALWLQQFLPYSTVVVGSSDGVVVKSRGYPSIDSISITRHIKRSMRFYRTTLTCYFRIKVYATYRFGMTFSSGYTEFCSLKTDPVSGISISYSICPNRNPCALWLSSDAV